MLSEAIKKNILEAFEIKRLWEENERDFNDLWRKAINDLFNKELPELVFEELKKRKVIDDDWEYLEGDFDINSISIKGFGIKKKKWNNFSYRLLRSKETKNIPKGSCIIFPAILSKEKVEKIQYSISDYKNAYAMATGTKVEDGFLRKPPILWWTDFPDNEYQLWKYEQWKEIKKNGKTVKYVSDFFEKLILASERDIDNTESAINE